VNTFVAVMAALGPASLIGTVVNAWLQRRKIRAEAGKTGADAAAVLTETATELLNPLRAELDRTGRRLAETNDRLESTEREMSALRRHLIVVEDLLRRNGIPVPEFVWPPSANGGRRHV
jgi:hypothetical protein